MPSKEPALLFYRGAVYRAAQEAPKPEDKQQRIQDFLRRREKEHGPAGKDPVVELTPEMKKKAPPQGKESVEIALTQEKLGPIWYALHDAAEEVEKKVNQDVKEAFDTYAATLLKSFINLLKHSKHRDLQAVGRLLETEAKTAVNLFKFQPPQYRQMSRFFDHEQKEAQIALANIINTINKKAKEVGWNIYS